MKIIDFVSRMKKKSIKDLLEISSGGTCVERTFTFKAGHAEITTIRGGAIEKAALSHLTLSGVTLPGTDEEVDPTVYQMEVFPQNPSCPMGHFNTEWSHGDTGPYFMNLDLFPAVRVDEDLAAMRRAMDHVADRFKKDRVSMREGLATQYNLEHWPSPLAASVGCKLMHLEEEEIDLFISAYETFLDTYLDIFRQRKDTPFTENEVRLKHERNGRWLEYIAFKDGAVKMAQAYGMPAEMLGGVTFPPSAVF